MMMSFTRINNIKKHKIVSILLLILFYFFTNKSIYSQVSLPERNPFKLSVRGGVLSNNNDLAAVLKSRSEEYLTVTINTDYSAIGEVELAADILKFRGASLGMQVSAMYSQPEYKSTGPDGKHLIGMTHLGIIRANITFSFNGSDPYTMFELPYHSNKEAVIGISGMIVRTEKTELTPYATKELMINQISGEYSQALGVTFGWNWRLGESGWVIGVNGAVMFVINKSHLATVKTDFNSQYSSGLLDFAPRILTTGIGYHF